jgi:hypothetical protein
MTWQSSSPEQQTPLGPQGSGVTVGEVVGWGGGVDVVVGCGGGVGVMVGWGVRVGSGARVGGPE